MHAGNRKQALVCYNKGMVSFIRLLIIVNEIYHTSLYPLDLTGGFDLVISRFVHGEYSEIYYSDQFQT